MKKKATLLALIACVFALCLTAFAVTGAEQARAEGETYTLTINNPLANGYDVASSLETWGQRYTVPTLGDDGSVTLTRNASAGSAVSYTAGSGKYSATANATYEVRLSIKTEGEVKLNFGTEKPGYIWLFANKTLNNADYVDYVLPFTNTKGDGADMDFIFQVNTAGTVYVKNFVVYEKTEKTVTAGGAIGELPAIAEKTGYAGYWTIDGEEITAETVYDYGDNKTAEVAYREVASVTFEENIAVSNDGWSTNRASDKTGITSDGEILTIDLIAAPNTYYTSISLVAGKTYNLSVEYKGTGSFHIFHMAENGSDWSLIKDWLGGNGDWASYSSPFAAGNKEAIIVQKAGDGVAEFRNFIISEVRNVEKGAAIGELPAIYQKKGYDEQYWAIDGERITAETVIEGNKKAKLVRKQACNISFVSDMYDYDMASSAETWTRYNTPAIENGVATLSRNAEQKVDMKDASGNVTGYYTQYAAGGVGKYTVTAGKTYIVTMKVKAANMHFNFAIELPEWKTLHSDWLYSADAYVDFAFNYVPTKDGNCNVIFQLDAGENDMYVKDLRIAEALGNVTAVKGEAYGELPSLDGIAVRHGYKLCWTIDGKEIASDAVCDYAGNKVARISEIVLEDAHSIVKVEAKAATCEENGYNEHYACECGKYFTDVDGYNEIADINAWKNGDGKVAATGHKLTKVDGTAATCTEDGVLDHYNCENCNNNYADDKAVYKIANLGSWVIGEGRIPATGHTLNEVAATDPTCVVDGHSAYYVCSVCNAAFKDSNGENIIEDLAAWKAGEGSIPAKGHIAGSVWATDENKHWHLCAVCNEKVAETEEDHAWNDGVITTAATCKSEGEKTYTCTVCEKTKTEVVEKTAHTPSSEWTTDENKHWHLCSVCNEKIAETEGDHAWNDGVITTAATCKSEGEKTYTCTVCEKTKTEVVEKTAHTPSSEWTTDEDKHWHVCSVCNVKLDEAAHADENADGKCDVCGAEVKSDKPDVPEESDKPAESEKPGESDKPEDSKTSEISGGCFSGMNGALGMISLLIAAGAAVIIAKRGRKE